MNKKLNKNSIYLKYKFCNNIHYRSKAWSVSKKIYFFQKCVFIQKGFVQLIETVIVKLILLENISILNKCCSF